MEGKGNKIGQGNKRKRNVGEEKGMSTWFTSSLRSVRLVVGSLESRGYWGERKQKEGLYLLPSSFPSPPPNLCWRAVLQASLLAILTTILFTSVSKASE